MENEYIIFIEEEDQPYSDIVVTGGNMLFKQSAIKVK